MLSDTDLVKIKTLLKNFASKDDLKNFATRDDLKNFATRDDLKNFATRDDLKNFATRDDVKNIVTIEIKPIKQDVAKIRKNINTIIEFFDNEYIELRKRVERIEEHLNLSPLQ